MVQNLIHNLFTNKENNKYKNVVDGIDLRIELKKAMR